MQTQIRLTKTTNVRDIYRNRRYRVEARFPGGRTIVKAKEATPARAFKAAVRASAPQTSPSAAGGSNNYTSNPLAATGNGGTTALTPKQQWMSDLVFAL